MAHLNHRGPEEKGPKTGRMLGNCHKTAEEQAKSDKHRLGKGLGRRRKGNCDGSRGQRNRASELFE
jgi:hypothetical protein